MFTHVHLRVLWKQGVEVAEKLHNLLGCLRSGKVQEGEVDKAVLPAKDGLRKRHGYQDP